jgi:hypothetical protein
VIEFCYAIKTGEIKMTNKRLNDYLAGTTLEEYTSNATEQDLFDFCQCIAVEKAGAENAIIKATATPDPSYSAQENDEFIARQRRRLGFIKACEITSVRALSKFKNERKRENRRENFSKQKLKLLKQAIKTLCDKKQNDEILALYGQLVEAALPSEMEQPA